MKKNIWLPTPYPAPTPAAVASYLLARGWVEFDTGDALWRTFHVPGELEHVAEVPMHPTDPRAAVWMARCLEAIAAWEKRHAYQILADVIAGADINPCLPGL